MRAAFDKFDTNRNGTIDAGELRDALREAGLDPSYQGAAEMLARFDRDRNARQQRGRTLVRH